MQCECSVSPVFVRVRKPQSCEFFVVSFRISVLLLCCTVDYFLSGEW